MENVSSDSYGERKLRISNDQLKQIVTAIVGKFVALQIDNPLLAMEAMFRFQTKEIKDQVLCNYELQTARYGLIGKETDQEKDKQMNEAYDANIIFEDEQAVFGEQNDGDDEEDQHVVDKNQWTQKQDEILIENYQNFANLEKKSRFTFLAELVGGQKTYKDCYNRAKLLKLKNGTITEAKEISSNLLGKQGEHGLKDRLVKHALNTLVKHLAVGNDGKVLYA